MTKAIGVTRSRAKNNEGSCRQVMSGRRAGKWRVQYIVKDGEKSKRISRLFDNESQGLRFLAGTRDAAKVGKVSRTAELLHQLGAKRVEALTGAFKENPDISREELENILWDLLESN
ncbi:MAG TPA: hypothetical protein VLA04_05365 [Verrucomicrobiae bacterium]|nr:hypothetical protein [Verrucomicrobiae bacterium]